jgi:Glutathione S-transferase, N-terminal domain
MSPKSYPENAGQLRLYSGPLSMFGAKAQIALHEKGLPFELVMVPFDMARLYEPKHPEVLRVNPKRHRILGFGPPAARTAPVRASSNCCRTRSIFRTSSASWACRIVWMILWPPLHAMRHQHFTLA